MAERLFIGVPLTDDVRSAIQKSLPKNLPGKAVPVENWHFTLRFLGATEPEARDRLIALLESATCGGPFRIRFSELGAFPTPRRARILWIGIDEGAERMIQLAAIAEGAARSVGFAAETKQFRPTLTTSRIDPPQSVVPLILAEPQFGATMTVDSILLYRSRLGGGPARYEELKRIALSR